MDNSTQDQKTRGEQRFAGLTYSQIADWTGLTLHTVRNYAQREIFDVKDLEGTLQWINSRRAKRKLPLIGIPPELRDSDGKRG